MAEVERESEGLKSDAPTIVSATPRDPTLSDKFVPVGGRDIAVLSPRGGGATATPAFADKPQLHMNYITFAVLLTEAKPLAKIKNVR